MADGSRVDLIGCRFVAHRVISLRSGFGRYRGMADIDQAAPINLD
jgi:hypothetical protein